MSATHFHFTVGSYKCTVVTDGTMAYTTPAKAHFANAPETELAPALAAYHLDLEQWREWISSFNCLVIRTGAHGVLVDAGIGAVDFAPQAGKLIENLHAAGVAPGDIDTVILTHAHLDHIGGVIDAAGHVNFPRARFVMCRAEQDFWLSDAALTFDESDANHTRRVFALLAGRLELIDADTEIVPGVHALLAAGHTPGHLAVAVRSSGEELLDIGDAAAHPLHMEHLEWHLAPDNRPAQALAARRRLLDRAKANHSLVLAFHFDFPGLGYFHSQQGVGKWQPL
jgi:glyoxylase-like metal-dependent hydrolase (beta-lactamase superfamily II)